MNHPDLTDQQAREIVEDLGVTVELLITAIADPSPHRAAFDKRWLAIATTHFQEGLMALRRTVYRTHNKF